MSSIFTIEGLSGTDTTSYTLVTSTPVLRLWFHDPLSKSIYGSSKFYSRYKPNLSFWHSFSGLHNSLLPSVTPPVIPKVQSIGVQLPRFLFYDGRQVSKLFVNISRILSIYLFRNIKERVN